MDINNDLFFGVKSWFENGTESIQIFHAYSNEVFGEFAINSPKIPKHLIICKTVGELYQELEYWYRNY